VEFQALLEDVNPGWREFTDVLRGAVKMQMTNAATCWKLAGGLAVVGAIAATAVSFRIPRIYESTAVMRVTPHQDQQRQVSQDVFQWQAAHQLNQMEREILSRTNLEGIITQPGLDLYKNELSLEPMADVEQICYHDIRIRMVNQSSDLGAAPAFAVSFSYTDQQKAQAVVRKLTTQFIEQNLRQNRFQARVWQEIWPQSAPPPGPNLEVLNPASLPRQPINTSRLSFATAGLVLGMALGLLAAVAWRRPKWTLQMAGFAVGCCLLATAVSFMLPESYTSSALMQITPPLVPANPTREIAVAPPAERLKQMEEVVLSDTILEEIITYPSLDLYKKQREHKPLDEIVETMRRDLSIRLVSPSHWAFQISFSYPDPFKAQAVVRELVTRFTEENVFVERERARASGDAKSIEILEHKVGAALEVLDPASDPLEPVSPNRLAIALAGFALGLLLGMIALHFRQHRSHTLRTA